MDKQRDLLPWIIGGVSLACVAAAITLGSTGPAPQTSPAPKQAAMNHLPAAAPSAVPANSPAAAPAPAPAPDASSAAIPAPALAAAPVQPTPPAGAKIWECTTNGQKTFSDKACGPKASLRELSSINIMNPTAPGPPPRSYPSDPSYAPNYAPDNYYPNPPQETVDGPYPVYIGIPYRDRLRPDHTHRPYHINHAAPGPSARRT
jgi:hypothetical protein